MVGLDARRGRLMLETETDREIRLRELASKLFFTLKKSGSRFGHQRKKKGRPSERPKSGRKRSAE
jgi:hypothetical protein